MDTQAKLELIKRNTEEIVTEDELKVILETITKPKVYTGYEPSGPVHIGHAVTVMKLRDMEEAGFHVKILLADVHALLNKKGTEEEIAQQCVLWEKAMNALGLKNPEIVLGSDFQYSKDYIRELHKLALRTSIKRGLRSMQEVARDIENATVSQMLYPLMQTLDIKYLDLNAAQGGMEQRKIHMLARELFPAELDLPSPTCVHTPLISALTGPGSKMSSSIPESMISVTDSDKDIQDKMKKAYCPAKVIDDNPVLQIARLIVFPNIQQLNIERPEKFGGDLLYANYIELENSFKEGNLHPLDLKKAIAKELAAIFAPVKEVFKN
ncbi:tyrosine--tRNA ligase [Candidatus Heimdallarchaeota archaeon]|nr:MAG: tyrosine--tRNA ligase [Candidatus Heimdallarchaeota archaeon]